MSPTAPQQLEVPTLPAMLGPLAFRQVAPGIRPFRVASAWTTKLREFVFSPNWNASLQPIPWILLLSCFELPMEVEVVPKGALQLADARKGTTVKDARVAFRAA
eukprot:1327333-Alexandrium_andersonii.AAC.1